MNFLSRVSCWLPSSILLEPKSKRDFQNWIVPKSQWSQLGALWGRSYWEAEIWWDTGQSVTTVILDTNLDIVTLFRFLMVTERSSTSLMTNTTGRMNHHTKHFRSDHWISGSTTPGSGSRARGRGMGPPASGTGPCTLGSTGGSQAAQRGSSAHQLFCVRSGLEHGRGFIRYPNGNSLDAEFVAGKIMGHGVFKWVEVFIVNIW